jgi:hypothetical protein
MKKSNVSKKSIFSVFFTIFCLVMMSNTYVWTSCEYCKEFTLNDAQLCTSSGECSILMVSGHSACCSNSVTSSDCSDIQIGGNSVRLYQFSKGSYCDGNYFCSNNSSSCPGDFIIASGHNCIPYGVMYSSLEVESYCN